MRMKKWQSECNRLYIQIYVCVLARVRDAHRLNYCPVCLQVHDREWGGVVAGVEYMYMYLYMHMYMYVYVCVCVCYVCAVKCLVLSLKCLSPQVFQFWNTWRGLTIVRHFTHTHITHTHTCRHLQIHVYRWVHPLKYLFTYTYIPIVRHFTHTHITHTHKVYTYIYMCICTPTYTCIPSSIPAFRCYGVAPISRLFEIIGLFCQRAMQKRLVFWKRAL